MGNSTQQDFNGDHSSKRGRPPQLDTSRSTAWWRHPLAAEWLKAEAQQVHRLLGPRAGQQILELLPEGVPGFSLPEAQAITWRQASGRWNSPVRACHKQLPVVNQSVDLVVWRYLEMNPVERSALLGEIHRCLRGGGQLLMVSLNPLQPACWRACDLRQLGQQALDLSWPLCPRGFRTESINMVGGRRLLRPVRLLLLRKLGDPRIIRPLRDPLISAAKAPAARSVPSCRAA